MLVATVAGVRRKTARMTGGARHHSALAVIQREGMLTVIFRGAPCVGAMA